MVFVTKFAPPLSARNLCHFVHSHFQRTNFDVKLRETSETTEKATSSSLDAKTLVRLTDSPTTVDKPARIFVESRTRDHSL